MANQSTYRIRTKLGEESPINIPLQLTQEFNSFEILSLNINTDDTYRSYTSNEGIVVGRVSTKNNGLGIPNVRVSIFVPKGEYNQSDEEAVMYPYSSPTDLNEDRIRYNLLPSSSDVLCYKVVGTLPTKREILDNETVCEVFDKFYKYTTVTNESGDYMLTNIPVGKQRLHIDADLSDIGPFLSQKPYDMIENLGFDKNKFDSNREFKTSNDLDSLVQIISQNKSIYVYPYWGDITENATNMKITRSDLSLNYEFHTNAIFIGSVITDKQSNFIQIDCTAVEKSGKMSDMTTGSGRIEMIRKTVDDKVEQIRIDGDQLINENGVWCYGVPMNLDYVRTDEFGNIIPTDDPKRGVATRARVRFRISMNNEGTEESPNKRASYLVPNNPKVGDEMFMEENDADYSFGSDTWDESYVDMFWNKVYTVKSYIPRLQKNTSSTNRKHTGIKMVNHFGDNNPFPYNGLMVKLSLTYRLLCVIIKVIIDVITAINVALSTIGQIPCYLYNKNPLKLFGWCKSLIPKCIKLSSEFCDDGVNKNVTYPGCKHCTWEKKTKPNCEKDQDKIEAKGGERAVCTNNTMELITCVENQLAQSNDATSFDFNNDWINGCLYLPLWNRRIRQKKSFFFGWFKRKAKDEWCAGNKGTLGHRDVVLASFCAHSNTGKVKGGKDFDGDNIVYHNTKQSDNCGDSCHKKHGAIKMNNGMIVDRENMFGQKVWYYKAIEVDNTLGKGDALATEYFSGNKPYVSKTLYATDIVLLGSLNDCDLNGIPKFYNYLKPSTYNMPTDILLTNTEHIHEFDEYGNVVEDKNIKMSIASGCDKGNKNEYGYYDGGLFYDIGCSSIKVDTPSCINLRRMCELGVGMDEIQYVEDIASVNISSETDQLDYDNDDFYLRPDGYISYDDIIDFDYRSMFATMNGNNLATKINKESGVREYDFRYMYIDNFDGSAHDFMTEVQRSHRPKANYRYNYNLEQANVDYLAFRMGNKPFYYDGVSLVTNEQYKDMGPMTYSLPKYQNSFYFYFGLKEGKTAIELFNDKYNQPCQPKTELIDTIPYKAIPNGWCEMDSDSKFKHNNYTGYLGLDLSRISRPCSAVFNSKTNKSVSYTVMKFRNENDSEANTTITENHICFCGDKTTPPEGYTRYYLLYENPSLETTNDGDDGEMVNNGEIENCCMMNNGEYTLIISDSEGTYHTFDVSIRGEYLTYDTEIKPFKINNAALADTYKSSLVTTPYYGVWTVGDVNHQIPYVDGVPFVERKDGKKKINGTICLYNIKHMDELMNAFMVEIEPYEKEIVNNKVVYVDKDLNYKEGWWDNAKVMVIRNGDNYDIFACSVEIDVENNSKHVIKIGDEQLAVFTNAHKAITWHTMKIGDSTVDCIVIRCPKGDVMYKVKVTQLCERDEKYYKTQNYVERKEFVPQPTPYKLYINDVDYDVIKNFKTGWILKDGNKQSNPQFFGADFNSELFKNTWLGFQDINNPYYNWETDKDLYGEGELNKEGYENYQKLVDNEPEVEIYELSYGDIMVNNKLGRYITNPYNKFGGYYWYENNYDLYLGIIKSNVNETVWDNKNGSTDGSPKINDLFNIGVFSKLTLDDGLITNDYSKVSHLYWDDGGVLILYIWNGKFSKDEYEGKIQNISETWQDCFTTYSIEEYLRIQTNYDDGYSNWIQSVQGLEAKATQIENRLKFIDKMIDAFCLTSEIESKNLILSVKTDDTPSSVYMFYNDESESDIDDTKHELNDNGSGNRTSWKLSTTTEKYIYDIKIPTITSYDDIDFGMSVYDNAHTQEKPIKGYTFVSTNKTLCFAQDNIAECSTNGVVNVKPPYYVMCVNSEGFTKPDNLTQSSDFVKKNNGVYGIDIQNKYIRKDDKEIFGFHIIDKRFRPNVAIWPYINNIPQFQTANVGENGEDCLVKCEGIMSGYIYNGVVGSGFESNKNQIVSDFEEQSFYNKEMVLITLNEEYDIPTKRLILDSTEGGFDTYRNYHHCDVSGMSDDIKGMKQYMGVPNKMGEMTLIDYESHNETSRTICGKMKIEVVPNTIIEYNLGENGTTTRSKERKISVILRNCDDDFVEYYIFQLKTNYKGIEYGKIAQYPLNAAHKDGNGKWYFNMSNGRWEGKENDGAQLFSSNTTLDVLANLADNGVHITNSTINEDGEKELVTITAKKKLVGHDNTGTFSNLGRFPYFIVAVTNSGNRCISPVYDINIIKCRMLLYGNDTDDVYYTRIAVVDAVEGGNINNYYIAMFGYTLGFKFEQDETKIERYSSKIEPLIELIGEDGKVTETQEINGHHYWITKQFNGGTVITGDVDFYWGMGNNISPTEGGNAVEGDGNDPNTGIGTNTENTLSSSDIEKIEYVVVDECIQSTEERLRDSIKKTVQEVKYGDELKFPTYDEMKGEPDGYMYYDCNVYNGFVDGEQNNIDPILKDKEGIYYFVVKGNNRVSVDDIGGDKLKVNDGNGITQFYKSKIYYLRYTKYDVESVDMVNPNVPHYKRYFEWPLTKDEYNKLKDGDKKIKTKYLSIYCTDVTGLKHKCKLDKSYRGNNGVSQFEVDCGYKSEN